MARHITFTDRAWDDYLWWQKNNSEVLEKIHGLVRECQRTPFTGLGKPEPLKNDLKGFWSRRITKADRFVYFVTTSAVEIVTCRFHYEK